MRPRAEAAIAVATVAVLITIAMATGRRTRGNDDPDQRATTFNAGREGARALADVAERLGAQVTSARMRPRALRARLGGSAAVVVIIEPTHRIPPDERQEILALTADSSVADLVLAGPSVASLMRCFGFDVEPSLFDSAQVAPPGGRPPPGAAWVHAHLVRSGATEVRDSSRVTRSPVFACRVPPLARVDTLLATTAGAPVMLRLVRADTERHVLLVADDALLRNRTLRASDTAPLVVDAVIGRSRHVVFDELHHGYGSGGSLLRVALDWSRRSPLGWMLWQLALVALLALLASGVRFGPVRRAIPRTRRSSLEHVRALATALAASGGHRVAIGAIVRGLRRRLAPAGRAADTRRHDDWRPWLESLVRHAATPGARASAEALVRAADSPEPDTAVLVAANAVEDLWKDVRP